MDAHRVTTQIAAVAFDRTADVDAALAEAVAALRRRGVVVGGLLQHVGERVDACSCAMWLEDLATGARRRIDRPRGAEAIGCALDPDALAAASCDLRAAIAGGCDLVVVNRFGKSEAGGGGLRDEIAEASLAGTPLLIAVREDMLAAWDAFVGGPSLRLKPEAAALVDWAEGVLALPAVA